MAIVYLDPGHGGNNTGCTFNSNGKREKEYTLEIARAVRDALVKENIEVIMSREEDVTVVNGDRPRSAERAKADCFVSIHVDDFKNITHPGFHCCYIHYPDFATLMCEEYGAVTGLNNKGIKNRSGAKGSDGTYLDVLSSQSVPSILIETGFANCEPDSSFLLTNQDKVAQGIFNGIMKFLNTDSSTTISKDSFNSFQDSVGATGNSNSTGSQATSKTGGLDHIVSKRTKGNFTSTSDKKTNNPLVPFHKPTIVPPSYYDNDLPSHRNSQVNYFFRIGDVQLCIPPTFISVTDETRVDTRQTIRQRESTKSSTGYSNRIVEVNCWFVGLDQINGIEKPAVGVNTNLSYYMDGLRTLIAQFKKCPFLPVVNELLNDVFRIYALTILDMSFSTAESMPNCVQAKLVFKEFNATPMIGLPTVCYDRLFQWDLFRWFYQQPLLNKESISKYRMPQVYTKNMVGSLVFRLLPEDILINYKNEYVANNHSQYQYIYNEWAFMEDVEMDYASMHVTSITASVHQMVCDLQLAFQPNATHQSMGCLDTMFSINIKSQSRKFVSQLTELVQTVQMYSRKYKNKITTGYLGISNEFINMFGVETVCVQGMQISTVEGFPDLFNIDLTLISYNKTQYEQEKPNGLAPHNLIDEHELLQGNKIDDYHVPILIEGVVEDLIKDLELYPDLELPTYSKVNEVISKINEYRKSKGFSSLGIDSLECPLEDSDEYFVDPDFYFSYPNGIDLQVMSIEELQSFYETYRTSDETRGMLDIHLKFGDGETLKENVLGVLRNCKELGNDLLYDCQLALDPETQDMPHVEDKDFYKLMMHDMVRFSRRYTMLRAFPTCLILFIDEGMKVRGTRLWSNFYSYHAIMDINIYRDKDYPADVCTMTLSNLYYSLSTKPAYTIAKKKNIIETFFFSVDDEMVKMRQTMYNFMNIEAGCRLHIRLGYGSNGCEMPIVFNGVVTEIESSDVMQITAQSDGFELTNPLDIKGEEDTNGVFKYGKETSNIIRTLLSTRADWKSAYNWIMKTPIGDYADDSKYGIEHFGYTYHESHFIPFKAMLGIGDKDLFSYDICKNVYKGLPFVNSDGKYRRTTLLYEGNVFKKDEYNMHFYLYGKTVWDLFKTLAFANTEYICATDNHGFRSTLFFGQPVWLYKYGYLYSGGYSQEERLKLENYKEKVKVYSQCHCINSLMDIIDNGIRATYEDLCTAVIPVYTEGSTTKHNLIIFADRNIYPDYQRTEYYDTTTMQDYFGPDALYKAFGVCPSQDTALTMGRSYLQYSFKNMYRGFIVTLGDPTIKPYDLLYLDDLYRQIHGGCYVGAVIHNISVQTGFITSIKPDLISTTHMKSSVFLGRVISMCNMFCFNYDIATCSLVASISAMKSVQIFKSLNQKWDERTGFFSATTLLPLAGAVAGAALTLATGGGALIALGGVVSGFSIAQRAYEWYQNVFKGKNRHAISLMPLIINDRPLIAGCKGYQTLIPGYVSKGNVVRYVQDETKDDNLFQTIINSLQEDYTELNKRYKGLLDTGIDIFELDMAGTNFDEDELWEEGSTGGLNEALFGKGVKPSGQYANNGSTGGGTATGTRADLINFCEDKMNSGCTYEMGGTGENNQYDCSGLMMRAYESIGIQLPRQSTAQIDFCTPITRDQLQPGDLVYTDTPCNHIMMYYGDGKIIHAANDNDNLCIGNLPTGDRVRYGRVPGMDDIDKAEQQAASQGTTNNNGSYTPPSSEDMLGYTQPSLDDFNTYSGKSIQTTLTEKRPANELNISKLGMLNSMLWESLVLEGYDDGKGVPTIGFGTIKYPDGRRVQLGDKCTVEQAFEWYNAEKGDVINAVRNAVKVPITQQTFDILCDIGYHLGTGGVDWSYGLGKGSDGGVQAYADVLNSQGEEAMYKQFDVWNKVADNPTLSGLVDRSEARKKYFKTGVMDLHDGGAYNTAEEYYKAVDR